MSDWKLNTDFTDFTDFTETELFVLYNICPFIGGDWIDSSLGTIEKKVPPYGFVIVNDNKYIYS